MYNNMLIGLLEHGRIKTTERRAQELRRLAERAVTRATRLGDILTRDRDALSAAEKAKLVHAMRISRRELPDREAVQRIFDDWAPLFIERPGGYTRVYKLGYRRGDNAPMALIEFVEMPQDLDDAPEADGAGDEKKGFFSRFKRS